MLALRCKLISLTTLPLFETQRLLEKSMELFAQVTRGHIGLLKQKKDLPQKCVNTTAMTSIAHNKKALLGSKPDKVIGKSATPELITEIVTVVDLKKGS